MKKKQNNTINSKSSSSSKMFRDAKGLPPTNKKPPTPSTKPPKSK